jgi:hypothetical protein
MAAAVVIEYVDGPRTVAFEYANVLNVGRRKTRHNLEPKMIDLHGFP